MRLADCRNLHHFGNAAHVRQRGAHVINIVVLHQRIEIPAIPPFLARRDGNLYELSQTRQVFAEGLRTHGILDEEGRKRFDQVASANGVRQIESLMKINAPVAVFAHAFARLQAFLVKLIQFLSRIERGIRRRVRRAHTESAVTGGNGSRRALFHAHSRLDPGNDAGCVVAFAIIPHHAPQDFVNRQLQHFAFDVPQRQIERAERMFFFPPRRVKKRPRHVLPQPFDMLRVLADQASGALLQSIRKTAFTNARYSRVGLDRHHGVGLIEQRIRIRRRISPHPRNLHLRQRRAQQRKIRKRTHSRHHCLQKGSPVHPVSPSPATRERAFELNPASNTRDADSATGVSA